MWKTKLMASPAQAAGTKEHEVTKDQGHHCDIMWVALEGLCWAELEESQCPQERTASANTLWSAPWECVLMTRIQIQSVCKIMHQSTLQHRET